MTAKFWIGGTGTWDNTGDTHWSLSSGGPNNTTHPVSTDTATLDGASGGGTVTVNADLSLQALTCGAFTGTLDFATNNNNVTLSNGAAFSNSGTGTRTVNLGSGTFTLSTTTANITVWDMTTVTGLTFSGASSTIDFTGVLAAGRGQLMATGNQTFGTVKISGARYNSGLHFTGVSAVIGTLNIAAATFISFPGNAFTITTLTQSAQFTLSLLPLGTLTITNAPTLTGSASAPLAIIVGAAATNAATTISCASGTFSGTWTSIASVTFSGGATFTFTNSLDLGRNSGATITAPRTAGLIYTNKMQGNVG